MQNIIFNILLLIIIIYTFFTNVEDFQSTGPTDAIKDAVKQVYLADVESIRNLSAVAKKLQADDGFIAPAHMSIRGKLNINSPSDAKSLPANVCLSVDNATETTIRLKTKADDAKNINLTNNDGNLTMGNAKGADLLNIKADGNVAIKQDLTTGSLTSSTIKAPGPMRIESTAITTTGSLTTGNLAPASLTTSGDINGNNISAQNIRALNNFAFNGDLFCRYNNIDINTRDYTPVILTFDARNIDNHNHFSTNDRIFVLQQQSVALCLWGEGGDNDRFWWINSRMNKQHGYADGNFPGGYYRYCRYAYYKTSLVSWRGIVVSVPAGKICKIYGDKGQLITLTPGYHQITLPWDPYLVWAGIADNRNHLPDNMNINAKTGL
jgi:hypothetical protein